MDASSKFQVFTRAGMEFVMICPYCETELEEYDWLNRYGKVIGTIWICPKCVDDWHTENDSDEIHNGQGC